MEHANGRTLSDLHDLPRCVSGARLSRPTQHEALLFQTLEALGNFPTLQGIATEDQLAILEFVVWELRISGVLIIRFPVS